MSKEINVLEAKDWSDDEAAENMKYLESRGNTYAMEEVLKARGSSWEEYSQAPAPEVFPQPDEDASDRGMQGSSYPVPAESGDGGDVPDGTVKEVLDWVGDDKSRAEAALEAEDEKGDDARVSLVEKLEAIVEDGEA